MSTASPAKPVIVSGRVSAMAKRGGGMGMGGRGGGIGGGMQFGKIGLKLDRMNLHALAERQNEEDVEEVGLVTSTNVEYKGFPYTQRSCLLRE